MKIKFQWKNSKFQLELFFLNSKNKFQIPTLAVNLKSEFQKKCQLQTAIGTLSYFLIDKLSN